MVEGPTAKAYAIRINERFAGEKIRDVFARSRKINVPVSALVGRKFIRSDSIGKNIIFFLEGDVAVRVHLMMFGAIHIYEMDEQLLKPPERIRLMLTGDHRRLVVYNAPIVEIDEQGRILEHLKSRLGPDPLSGEWSAERACENIMKLRDERIGVVLLDQSVIAGIGNILRNEILFRAGVDPERAVKDLSREEVMKIVHLTKELSERFLELLLEGKGVREMLYVYNRFGLCKVCGHPIKFYRQKPINRKTFVCESCQR